MLDRVTKTFVPRKPNGIFMLGEFAEINDQKRGYHFSGGSGQELKKICTEQGFSFYDCYHDMVFSCKKHTKFEPEVYINDWTKQTIHLNPTYEAHVHFIKQAIYDSNCTLVVALGDLALFILVGEKSASKWRGSLLYTEINGRRIKVIPTYAPSRILKVWNWRYILEQDIQRVWNEHDTKEYIVPKYNFIVKPDFNQVRYWFASAQEKVRRKPTLISHDLETLAYQISCSGIALDSLEAICIPFMTREEGNNHSYWSVDEEVQIVKWHRELLEHKNARVIGQNYLYDAQHIARQWGFYPRLHVDTMLAWHTIFPGERKSLDFLASFFCDYYVFWKDELKDYNKYPDDEILFWNYNCKDAVYTYEIAEKILQLIPAAAQTKQYEFQMGMNWPVFKTMIRGVRIDLKYRRELSIELFDVSAEIERRILAMAGDYHPPDMKKPETFWFNSSKQTASFFYDYLHLPKQRNRKTYKVSCDDEALIRLAQIEPIILPIVRKIQELRSVNIFRKNFVDAPLGNDNRIRCSYNLAGTGTFRLASSKDAFGRGANLQTIPSGNEDK